MRVRVGESGVVCCDGVMCEGNDVVKIVSQEMCASLHDEVVSGGET